MGVRKGKFNRADYFDRSNAAKREFRQEGHLCEGEAIFKVRTYHKLFAFDHSCGLTAIYYFRYQPRRK